MATFSASSGGGASLHDPLLPAQQALVAKGLCACGCGEKRAGQRYAEGSTHRSKARRQRIAAGVGASAEDRRARIAKGTELERAERLEREAQELERSAKLDRERAGELREEAEAIRKRHAGQQDLAEQVKAATAAPKPASKRDQLAGVPEHGMIQPVRPSGPEGLLELPPWRWQTNIDPAGQAICGDSLPGSNVHGIVSANTKGPQRVVVGWRGIGWVRGEPVGDVATTGNGTAGECVELLDRKLRRALLVCIDADHDEKEHEEKEAAKAAKGAAKTKPPPVTFTEDDEDDDGAPLVWTRVPKSSGHETHVRRHRAVTLLGKECGYNDPHWANTWHGSVWFDGATGPVAGKFFSIRCQPDEAAVMRAVELMVEQYETPGCTVEPPEPMAAPSRKKAKAAPAKAPPAKKAAKASKAAKGKARKR